MLISISHVLTHTTRSQLSTIGAAVVLLASASVSADSLHFESTNTSYEIDSSRIAVFAADGVRSVATLQSLPGVRKAELHAVSGWALLTLDAPAQNQRSLDVAIDSIADTDAVRFASPVAFDALGGPMFVHPQIVIKLDASQRSRAADVIGSFADVTIVGQPLDADPDTFTLRVDATDGQDVLALANQMTSDPRILWAEPDVTFTGRGALIPNDPDFGNLWGIRNTGQFTGAQADFDMDGDEAWDITTGDNSIITVIIDTGAQQDHPDINQRAGIDTTSDNGNGGPVNGFDNHGTPVASCVSSIINNNTGVVGIAPNTRSASARTFISINSSGSWTSNSSWTVDTLNWATSIGARVTNNSNSYGFTSAAVENAYASTRSSGMVHFASAGNDNSLTIAYPSSLSTVVSVAASALDGDLASFSNRGLGIGITAPGSSIFASDRTGSDGYGGGDTAIVSGTSFASPYTAGVAALVLSVNPSLSAQAVEDILFGSAVDLGSSGYDTTYGWGHVNAHAAVLLAQEDDCQADLSGDGEIDISDLLQLLAVFNTNSTDGDVSGDGQTDISDLLQLLAVFDTACP